MPDPIEQLDAIWLGDLLCRRDEAEMLQRFLVGEAAELGRVGRRQAYVLGLDAAYGEGKTWFLERLAAQLALQHPVARIDAWADDTNDQPLVALMAAVEGALAPYFQSKTGREKLDQVTSQLLPIIGKSLISAGGRLAAKYIGEQVADELGDVLSGAQARKEIVLAVERAEQTAEKAVDGVIDRHAKNEIEKFRIRKASVAHFKTQLSKLVAGIDAKGVVPPVFIILDELDRCRPTYAIAMLEEIKHLFDVSGFVFILAMHGSQLATSINVVYGQQFDSAAYLRRFLSRTYELRHAEMSELTKLSFITAGIDESNFRFPNFFIGEVAGKHTAPEFAAATFRHYGLTARDVHRCIDALRVFCGLWKERMQIELPLALSTIISWYLKNHDSAEETPKERRYPLELSLGAGRDGKIIKSDLDKLCKKYLEFAKVDLPRVSDINADGVSGYVRDGLLAEFQLKYQNSYQRGNPPYSIIGKYRSIVEMSGRFSS